MSLTLYPGRTMPLNREAMLLRRLVLLEAASAAAKGLREESFGDALDVAKGRLDACCAILELLEV